MPSLRKRVYSLCPYEAIFIVGRFGRGWTCTFACLVIIESLPERQTAVNDQPILHNEADFPPSERDSPPWTLEELKRAKRRPRVFVMRRALHMTQEQFAKEFMIPRGTLRD